MTLPLSGIITLAILGLPLFCVLGAVGLVGLHHDQTPLAGALADVYALAGGKAVALSTIPLFTFAGYLMARAKTAERLVRMAKALLGWIPGGLALMTVWTCAFFTIFTGASGVTIVALGGLLLPELERSGYSKRFSIEVVTGSGSVGLLFPPALAAHRLRHRLRAQRRPGEHRVLHRALLHRRHRPRPGAARHPLDLLRVRGLALQGADDADRPARLLQRLLGGEVGGADPLRHPGPARRAAGRCCPRSRR